MMYAKAKALIRLWGCTGWSDPVLLFFLHVAAYKKLHVLTYSYTVQCPVRMFILKQSV